MSTGSATPFTAPPRPVDVPVIHIRPSRGWELGKLAELWQYRELLYFLVWRDLKVRYKQTVIGVAWAVIQPLAMILVFTLFFGKLAKLPSEGIPYPLFACAGLLPWQTFSRTISESANSLVADQRLITRVYFPRLLIPVSTILGTLVDFAIAAVLLGVLMAGYGIAPAVSVVWLPLFVGLMLATALGVGFWLSALNLEYRDVRYVLPFMSQLWLFLTPVVYPSSMVPPRWRLLYGLNPMVGVVEGFRWAVFGVGEGPSLMIAVSFIMAFGLLLSGMVFFQVRERTFADVLGSGGR